MPNAFAVKRTLEALVDHINGYYVTPYTRQQGINADTVKELAIQRVVLEHREIRCAFSQYSSAREPWYCLDLLKILGQDVAECDRRCILHSINYLQLFARIQIRYLCFLCFVFAFNRLPADIAMFTSTSLQGDSALRSSLRASIVFPPCSAVSTTVAETGTGACSTLLCSRARLRTSIGAVDVVMTSSTYSPKLSAGPLSTV